MDRARRRCAWAQNPLLVSYHDREWGRPVHDDPRLFEMLCLEGAQAGLSWETILRKREAYRKAFSGFDPEAVSRMSQARVSALLLDPSLVRNRAKLQSVPRNARAVREVQEEFSSLDAYLWAFVKGRALPRSPRRRTESPESRALSRDLRRRGFSFVGPTICYAFMQAVGMVNDHEAACFLARPHALGDQGVKPRRNKRPSVVLGR